MSSARSRSSRALRCAYSRPSSAFCARNSRVSSPDFGANKIPTSAPIPSPTRKKLTFEPALFSDMVYSFPALKSSTATPQKQSEELPFWHAGAVCPRQVRGHTLGEPFGNDPGDLFDAGRPQLRDATEIAQWFMGRARADSGDILEPRLD